MHILALHGFTGLGTDFAPFAERCGGIGHWHCPNLPGHGPEPVLDCSPESTMRCIESHVSGLRSQVSDFNSQVSDPSPILKVLLGYSMGARAALLHAVRNPEAWDALILISPNPGIEAELERAERRANDARLAGRIEREGTEAFLHYWQSTAMIRSQQRIRPDWHATMQAKRREHTASGLAASLLQFGQGSTPNLWPELPKLRMPVLLLTGAEDGKYTCIAQRMQAAMSGHGAIAKSHVVLSEAGHMPHLEQAEATARAIRDYMTKFATRSR